MKSALLILLLSISAHATVERVAVCNHVIEGNFRNHARATVTAADITVLKSSKGYVLNEDWERREATGYPVDQLDLSMSCRFQKKGSQPVCNETKNHLEMGLKYKRGNTVRVFATYSKNSGRLHVTTEIFENVTYRPLADVVLQCVTDQVK